MQITVCDCCKEEINPFTISGQVGGEHYRFLVQKAENPLQRGHWAKVDVCEKCFVKLLAAVLNPDGAIADKQKEPEEQKTGITDSE